jgi:hypothetical protein
MTRFAIVLLCSLPAMAAAAAAENVIEAAGKTLKWMAGALISDVKSDIDAERVGACTQ